MIGWEIIQFSPNFGWSPSFFHFIQVILRSNGYWYHSNLRVLHNGCMDLLETELSFAGKFWCLTRMVYLPMAYLYGKKFVGPITPTIIDIREEIYAMSYEKIDWSEARTACAKVFNIPFSFYNFSLHYVHERCGDGKFEDLSKLKYN